MKYAHLKGLNSLLVIRVIILFVTFCLVSNIGLSQIKISFDTILVNSEGIKISDFEKWSKSKDLIIFFCPTSEGIADSLYSKKTQEFINDKRFQGFNGEFKLIFFKEYDNNSKNPFILKSFKNNDSIINQLQCFVLINNEKVIKRAQHIYNEKFNYRRVGDDKNLFEIKILDFACPKDLPSKMVFYLDFLNELFVPNYSMDEKFEFLKEKIISLENAVNKLTIELEEIKKTDHIDNNKNSKKNKIQENSNSKWENEE